ncbi:MAG: hypothetical protein VX205_11450 [Pseudomonadota bacterium]|nr:hypothetical protein [Sphingobium naphthae]MEC7930820.1 hypothetical protein [Pseudomonadota bacterium]MEC8035596.1 hypothetical protein [Pseudomonadota bacterium]
MKPTIIAIMATLLLSGTAMAQDKAKKDDTLDKAGTIASQPARDIGLDKDEIPPVLTKAVDNPYAAPASRSCKGLNRELGALNAALGEDFTASKEANEDRTGKIAEAIGKTVVNSLIPFRGLVREISGAAPAERRLQAAATAGIARRGYMRGLASAKGCKIAPIAPEPVARSDGKK